VVIQSLSDCLYILSYSKLPLSLAKIFAAEVVVAEKESVGISYVGYRIVNGFVRFQPVSKGRQRPQVWRRL